MKKNVLRIVGIIFLVFLSWRVVLLIKSSGEGTGQQGRPPVAIEVDTITFEPIKEIREFTGTVYPIYQYVVAPKVSGRVVELTKRIGDWVNTGELIARIDDAEYQQAVYEAEANLKIAQASLTESESQFELSRQEMERVQSLQKKGIASPSELDTANTTYEAQKSRLELARAQVEQREASLSSAKIRLSYTVLKATEPGFIGERYVDEGSLLAPNAPLVSVIGIKDVLIRTTIIERDYGRITVGQSSEVEVDAFPSKRFQGKVARIAPLIQEASRVAKMEVEVANDSLLLKPGMFTRVRVILSEKDSARVVPSEAIIRREGHDGIFIVQTDESAKTNIARYYPVTTGIVTQEKTEILSPELTGQVVTLGQHLLEDGSPVILPESGRNSVSAQDGKNSPGLDKESGR
ncbi:MAG: efflux RND transporter periplasmic adaptor subunit [Candidatus Latescibacteria bacterium]|nr:efflux RND transporter periplasmic adaptor subunit [Candidatus Latescibacterota bacterium]